MPRVKKLTVAVFDDPGCPKNATCAAVDSDGVAAWYTAAPERVTIHSAGNYWVRDDWVRDDWSTVIPIPGIFDSSDWKNSKIINPKYRGKKLTDTVFDDWACGDLECGFDPVCAMVQPDGSAFLCATADLETVDEFEKGWGLTKKAALRLKDVPRDEIWCEIGGGYDASDWQHSMVLRPGFTEEHQSVADTAPVSEVPASGLPDSGKRESFNTGAVRDDAGDKPRPDLISPFFLERLGEHMRKGAIKYEANNWARGIPNSRCWASLQRHLMKFAQGLHDEDHLAAAAFNLMAIIHNEEVAKRGIELKNPMTELVDMPLYGRKN